MYTYYGLLEHCRNMNIAPINNIGNLFTVIQESCEKINIHDFENMQIGYEHNNNFYPVTSIKDTRDAFVFYTDEIHIRNPKTVKEAKHHVKELYTRLKRTAWMLPYSSIAALKVLIATEDGRIQKVENIDVKENKIILKLGKEC